jgi:hypothetical protein
MRVTLDQDVAVDAAEQPVSTVVEATPAAVRTVASQNARAAHRVRPGRKGPERAARERPCAESGLLDTNTGYDATANP